MSAICFGNNAFEKAPARYTFDNIPESVKPGTVIALTKPPQGHGMSYMPSAHNRLPMVDRDVYEVKARVGDALYGQRLTDLNQTAKSTVGHSGIEPSFQIIGRR